MVKNAASARNGRPKRICVTHAGASRVLRTGTLHAGSILGRAYRAETESLRAHLGTAPTLPQERLIEQGARLHLLASMAWAEVLGAGQLIAPGGHAHPAIDVLLRTLREQRAVLELLGIERHARQITLPDILSGKADLPEPDPEDENEHAAQD
jgi:hypothetical protein